MIYEFSREVEAKLRARGYPVVVHYAPERTKRRFHDTAILIERDRSAGDSLATAHGQQQNPRKYATRTLGVIATILAKSSLDAAHVGDHERLCEQLVDAFVVAATEWGIESRAGVPQFTSLRYLAEKERDDVEVWPGVAYELRFRVARGVVAVNYDGTARPTAVPIGVSNRTDVRYTGDSVSEPEVGCGG